MYTYTFRGTRPTPGPWPAMGTWKFGANPETSFTRMEDDVLVIYAITGDALTLTFDYAGCGVDGSARTGSVAVACAFTFHR